MRSRPLTIIVVAILTLAVAGAIGGMSYNAGLARGLAQSSQALAAPNGGAVPAPLYAYGHGWHPWGFGFFPVFPFFGVLLIVFAARFLFWRGPWGPWPRGGYWAHGVPPAFEEWHRRAHEHAPAPPASPAASS